MAYSRLSYKGASVQTTLASQISATAQSMTLSTDVSASWPAIGAPFFVVIDPGTTKEEKVCVVRASSTTLNVVDPDDYTDPWATSVLGRGADNTTAYVHDSGAVIYPVFTAREANQANELVSSYTTNGDLVVHGSTSFKTISIGSPANANDNKVLTADSSIIDGGVKWGQVATGGITDGAVTEAKLATDSVTAAKIAAGAVGASELATNAVEEAKINTGAVTAAKIATNAVEESKINAGAVTAAKIGSSAVETSKINNGAVTAAKLASDSIQLLAPSGSITQYGGSSAPTGWMLCDGSQVAIASFTALYNVLTSSGTVFPFGANTNGSGAAGSTHFRLPNFKGRVPVGLDSTQTEFDAMGEIGGAKTHPLTVAQLPAHTHTVTQIDAGGHTHTVNPAGDHTHDVPSRSSSSTANHSHGGVRLAESPSTGTTNGTIATVSAGSHGHTMSDPGNHSHSVSVSGGGNGSSSGDAHNNLQPYITINYIIKT